MHWIRTDKMNSVSERGRFRTIKKLIVLPARYMIRYDYFMTIIIIRNYYYSFVPSDIVYEVRWSEKNIYI